MRCDTNCHDRPCGAQQEKIIMVQREKIIAVQLHKQRVIHSCIIVIMADTWFTSDFHLGHFNITRYCNRPFADTREMDEVIVDIGRASCRPNDTLYFRSEEHTSELQSL